MEIIKNIYIYIYNLWYNTQAEDWTDKFTPEYVEELCKPKSKS